MKQKLVRYSALSDFDNVIELEDYSPDTVSKFRGRWKEAVFGNENPLILELACGKGDYSLELASRYPDKNFVGIDIKGDRIWRGAVEAKERGLENVRFLRIYIDHINNYFGQNEVDDIWITFPDPYLGEKKASKRLTSEVFLDRYRKLLKKGGSIRLKTDSPELFSFTKEVVSEQNLPVIHLLENVHARSHEVPDMDILTYYEKMHLEEERIIRFIQFSLTH